MTKEQSTEEGRRKQITNKRKIKSKEERNGGEARDEK